MKALLALVLVASCSSDAYVIVTVNKRPAVHDATKLRVALGNAGTMRTDDLDLKGKQFPVTFSINAGGRSGDLSIAIDALDIDEAVVGRGSSTTPLDTDAASVMLDSADFVVNTDYLNDQFTSDDFEAVGLQLAATTDGKWMVVFRDSPCTSCNIYGRRFDPNGVALESAAAAGTGAFKLSTTLTTSSAQAAVATSGTSSVAFWDFTNVATAGQGVACRALDPAGAPIASQIAVANDPGTDVVSAATLSNGNIALVWNASGTGPTVIRTTIVRPTDCMQVLTPVQVSTTIPSFSSRRGHVASNNGAVLYAWINDSQDVYIRIGNNGGGFPGFATDTLLLAHTGAQTIDHVRIAPLGTGFAVVVRWSSTMSTGPGKIELYKISATGSIMGTPTLITDKSGSDFASDKAFGVGTRSDGSMMVVWHQCSNSVDMCDVYGRFLDATGATTGEPFVLSTTTIGDQLNPSVAGLPDGFVAAWNDKSGGAPDPSGFAVRARTIYPTTGSSAR